MEKFSMVELGNRWSKIRLLAWACISLLNLTACEFEGDVQGQVIVGDPSAATAAPAPTPSAIDWLIQKVCIDAADRVLLIDPYECASPNHLRSLKVGEALPYHKHDQPLPPRFPDGLQRHDSYPILDRDEQLLIANPFSFSDPSFDPFKPNGDGYDTYLIRNGWAVANGTRDGGGYTTTFFGEGCKRDNGWVFFPVDALKPDGSFQSGEQIVPISGRHWEQNGEVAPGACPLAYSRDSLTSWNFAPKYAFGGLGGNPVKTLDTIVSIHGYQPTTNFLNQGHLEVFYFTQLYGITRWEVWFAKNAGKAANPGSCAGSTSMNYKGVDFVRYACRDWSAVTVERSSKKPTFWPILDVNMLDNWHFDRGTLTPWRAQGGIVTSLMQSTTARDKQYGQVPQSGVRYLSISCTAPCRGDQSFYQDIPVTRFKNGEDYAFGATVRSEVGSGQFNVQLMQVDATGKAIANTIATVSDQVSDQQRLPLGILLTGADSIPLSSQFVVGRVKLMLDPDAVAVRIALVPGSVDAFDVTDAWVARD